jgi:hypothetical protein
VEGFNDLALAHERTKRDRNNPMVVPTGTSKDQHGHVIPERHEAASAAWTAS